MKVCFLSARPLGLQGTPGTYIFLQKIVNYIDALVISRKDDHYLVDSPSLSLPNIPVKNNLKKEQINDVLPAIKHFDPDIFYIFNFPEWPICVAELKNHFQEKRIVLDIKTPLLVQGEKRQWVQKEGQNAAKHLDVILTLSKESVSTWIPECNVPTYEYPLGIDVARFPDPTSFSQRNDIHRFIYTGTLKARRKIDKLIDCFLYASDFIKKDIQLDLYGRGLDNTTLNRIENRQAHHGSIVYKGLVQQNELYRLLPDYGAGIAWVPTETFNDSPSLKALEYMAAGLPTLASNTNAHIKLVDQGYYVHSFNNNQEDFAFSLKTFYTQGTPLEDILKNRKLVEDYDYEKIIHNFILPVLKDVSSKPTSMKKCKNLSPETHLSNSDCCIRNTNFIRNESKRLRIVLSCNTLALGKGGSERVAMETAVNMGKRGHIVYIAYANNGYPAYERDKNVVYLPFDSWKQLSGYIYDIDPDIFFVFYFNRRLIYFYSLAHKLDIPFGMQECTNPERMIFNNWGKGLQMDLSDPVKSWERELIAAAAHRIRLTMDCYVQSFPGYIQNNVRSFPNPSFPQINIANPAFDTQSKTIVNIGGMKANKNLLTLLRAFHTLIPEFPDWQLKIFGKTAEGAEPHKVEIRKFIQDNEIEERVHICGPTDDIFAEFVNSHIHVIASLSEGCPTCVLEAMATGVPSIGFADCPGTNELIRHGENGLLAAPGDRVGNLREELRKLMASAELREKLGKKALQDSKQFAPETIYDQWEQLFYEAAEYKHDPDRLFREQMEIDPERAMHARRMREKLMQQIKVT